MIGRLRWLALLLWIPLRGELAITHVTIVDTAGGPPRTDMTVLAGGERITALGKTGKVQIPRGVQEVQGQGKFLIPGLWDMHVHLASDKEALLPMFVSHGITGVRSMFDRLDQIRQWRKEIADGLAGPRILTAGPILDGPGSMWPGAMIVRTAEEGRQAVANLRQGGADFVKVYNKLSREAYFAIADEARKMGMVFTGHVPAAITAAEASRAGQKSIEHLTGILAACSTEQSELMQQLGEAATLQGPASYPVYVRINARAAETYSGEKAAALFTLFRQNATWQTPTLTVLRAMASLGDRDFTNDSRLRYIPAPLQQFWNPATSFIFKEFATEDFARQKQIYRRQLEIAGALHRAGVEMLAGTDTPNPYVFPGFSLHEELELLVKAGLTPAEALRTATYNPAKFLGLLDSSGTVDAGRIADLVLLDSNPIDDIANTRKIRAVVLNGRLFEKPQLDQMLKAVEARVGR
ncbi:MAG: amidohydrolase family protein [Acidobacteria bacterium]|nr:amidohydrolase family protein [Acidobacteriota bacterium]MBI3470935.1 amidohydrolase family protein [Candidatus Solibacter usitatus]